MRALSSGLRRCERRHARSSRRLPYGCSPAGGLRCRPSATPRSEQIRVSGRSIVTTPRRKSCVSICPAGPSHASSRSRRTALNQGGRPPGSHVHHSSPSGVTADDGAAEFDIVNHGVTSDIPRRSRSVSLRYAAPCGTPSRISWGAVRPPAAFLWSTESWGGDPQGWGRCPHPARLSASDDERSGGLDVRASAELIERAQAGVSPAGPDGLARCHQDGAADRAGSADFRASALRTGEYPARRAVATATANSSALVSTGQNRGTAGPDEAFTL